MKRTLVVSVALMLVTISWSASIMTTGPWAIDSAAVLAASMCVLAAVATTGIVVASSRWGVRLAIGVALLGPALGVALPAGIWWAIELIVSALVVAALAGTATSGVVRRLPSAAGPTPRMVAFSLFLVSVPLVVAVVSPDGLGVAEWIMIAASSVAAGLYTKAGPLALASVRAGLPVTSIVAAAVDGVPRGVMWLLVGAVITVAAWHKDIRLGVHPLVEPGRRVSMPPELVPAEILEAAGLDEHGRPKRRS